jgi:hypothetical protein
VIAVEHFPQRRHVGGRPWRPAGKDKLAILIDLSIGACRAVGREVDNQHSVIRPDPGGPFAVPVTVDIERRGERCPLDQFEPIAIEIEHDRVDTAPSPSIAAVTSVATIAAVTAIAVTATVAISVAVTIAVAIVVVTVVVFHNKRDVFGVEQ